MAPVISSLQLICKGEWTQIWEIMFGALSLRLALARILCQLQIWTEIWKIGKLLLLTIYELSEEAFELLLKLRGHSSELGLQICDLLSNKVIFLRFFRILIKSLLLWNWRANNRVLFKKRTQLVTFSWALSLQISLEPVLGVRACLLLDLKHQLSFPLKILLLSILKKLWLYVKLFFQLIPRASNNWLLGILLLIHPAIFFSTSLWHICPVGLVHTVASLCWRSCLGL